MAKSYFSETISKPATGVAVLGRDMTLLAAAPSLGILLGRNPADLTGQHLTHILPDTKRLLNTGTGSLSGGYLAKTAIAHPVGGLRVYFDIQIQPNPRDDSELILTLSETPESFLQSRRVQAENPQRSSMPLVNLAERVTELETLQKIGLAIASDLDLETLLTSIVTEAVRLLRARSCSILLLDEESGDLIHRASVDPVVGARVPQGKGIVQTVLKTGIPRMVDRVQDDPDHYPLVASITGIETKTLLAAPLIVNEDKIGVITAINKKGGRFDERDLSLMTMLASFASVAIANAQLFEASQNRLRELALLVNASTTLSTTLEIPSLFPSIAQQIIAATPTNEFTISIWNRDTDAVTTVLNYSEGGETGQDAAGKMYPLEEYPATRKTLEARIGAIINIGDPNADAGEVALLRNLGFKSLVMVPLVIRNEVTGLLEFYSITEKAYSASSLNLFQTLANQIAAALENARLFEETRTYTSELEQRVMERTAELEVLYMEQTKLANAEREQRALADTLREAGAIVAATLDMDEAIAQILPQLARVIPYDSASVQLLEGNYLEIVGGGGWVAYEAVIGYRFNIPGPNPNSLVIQQKRPIILSNQELAWFDEFQKATHGNIKSWLGVPLVVHDKVIGMLTLDSTQPNFFTAAHAKLAEAFATQVAVAIEQARLFQQTRAAVDELETLRSIIAEISDERDLARLLDFVLERACHLLGVKSGELGLYREEADAVEIAALHEIGGGFLHSMIRLGDGLLGWVAKTCQPKIVNDYPNWEHALESFRHGPWRAVMAVPLIYQHQLIGVMALADTQPGRQFSESDLQLLGLLAHQVSIAIVNAQLFQQVQLLATTDDLTGLPNRRELFKIGRDQFNQAKRLGMPFSAIMFDIDHFKKVNDSYGHAIGDQVLKGMAKICLEKVREIDILARYGGEEFTLLLPHTNLDGAIMVAERLRIAVEHTPVQTDQGMLNITISLGVAALASAHETLAELLDLADTALYQAKNTGRNKVHGLKEN
jgi:diguanylate cyclase (GGDEF)-like protein